MNKIKTTEPKVLWKLRCKLGEGTLWVKEHNSIYFPSTTILHRKT